MPVNPLNFRRPRKGMMLVGAAGPATNLALGLGFALFYHLLKLTGLMQPAMVGGLAWAVLINTILAFFNLIPVPPLDGSRIVAGLLPRDAAIAYDRVGRFGLFIVIGLIMWGGFRLIVGPALVYTSWLLGVQLF